ncbi:ABC transporter ATP-binding protein/permease [Nocardioides sp. WS12]|uniref:ABC transporter ATP-binding protein/permease n=1 Tax=Nocardioides sp. WS12 TaxID=2486272 RepID=UPI0015FE1EA3|nr:ABC transporter ATP-binding protein/permease [Nocardioides sp. WS12]
MLRDLGKSFPGPPTVEVLRGVDLEIRQGEFVAIVGPSGSGKSTLLNVIALLDIATNGSYWFEGRPAPIAERQRARSRATSFGFVFQSFHLMARRTALENVETGLLYTGVRRDERRQRAREALAAVGLEHRMFARCETMSGGERQRVAIARAMIGRPAILIADEPTGNLDSAASEQVVANLKSAHAAGTTVVMVTHDDHLAATVPRTIQLRDGKVVADRSLAALHSGDRPTTHLRTGHPIPGRARVFDLVRDAVRGQLSRPGRTAGLVAAVTLAVALVVITLGLSASARAQVGSTFDARLNRSVSATYPSGTLASLSIAQASQFENELEDLAGVESAGVVLELDTGVLRNGSGAADSIVQAISPSLLDAAGASVRWAPGVTSLTPRTVVLGSILADQLDLGPLSLAPVVMVRGIDFQVVGIVDDGGRNPQLAGRISMSFTDIDGFGEISAAQIFVRTQAGAARQVGDQARLVLLPQAPESLEVEIPPDPVALREDIEDSVRSALLALSALTALMSILGVANALMLSVVERIGEIGLRRALGAGRRQILILSTSEAATVGVLGGVSGLFVGCAAIIGVTVVRGWQPVFDPRLGIVALGCGVLVGVLGGIPAALKAARIQPSDALRR